MPLPSSFVPCFTSLVRGDDHDRDHDKLRPADISSWNRHLLLVTRHIPSSTPSSPHHLSRLPLLRLYNLPTSSSSILSEWVSLPRWVSFFSHLLAVVYSAHLVNLASHLACDVLELEPERTPTRFLSDLPLTGYLPSPPPPTTTPLQPTSIHLVQKPTDSARQ